MVHAYNPSTLGGQDGQITLGQEFEISLANMLKPRSYQKYKKLAGCGGAEEALAATREAEAEKSLEPGR